MKEGIIYVPYILTGHIEESLTEYDKFMEKYHKLHKCCPKCGISDHNRITLVAYPLEKGKEHEYKDLNKCICLSCGDRHTKHERIENKNK